MIVKTSTGDEVDLTNPDYLCEGMVFRKADGGRFYLLARTLGDGALHGGAPVAPHQMTAPALASVVAVERDHRPGTEP